MKCPECGSGKTHTDVMGSNFKQVKVLICDDCGHRELGDEIQPQQTEKQKETIQKIRIFSNSDT